MNNQPLTSWGIACWVENPFVLGGWIKAKIAAEFDALLPAILDKAFKGEL